MASFLLSKRVSRIVFYNNKENCEQTRLPYSFNMSGFKKTRVEWKKEKKKDILTILCICNRQQNIPSSELLHEKYENDCSATVLSGKFIESNTVASQMHWKYAQETCFNESKLRKLIFVWNRTSIPFKDVLKSTELFLWFRGYSFSFLCRDEFLAVQKQAGHNRIYPLPQTGLHYTWRHYLWSIISQTISKSQSTRENSRSKDYILTRF